MIDALTTTAAGLRTATSQFSKAAQNVVKATVPGSDGSTGDDLPAAIVDSQQSAIAFKANVASFKTADKMLGRLIDTLA